MNKQEQIRVDKALLCAESENRKINSAILGFLRFFVSK